VLLMVLHGPIATNILEFDSAALAALSMGIRCHDGTALIVGIAGYLVSLHPYSRLSQLSKLGQRRRDR